MTASGWRAEAASKRNDILVKIPQAWLLSPEVIGAAKQQRAISGEYIEGLLDERSRAITSSSNERLLYLMANGKLSAVDVVTAFCKRAAYAHQLNHNLLEIAFDTARQMAIKLDQYYQSHGQLAGPLHGLPYSMKDQWHIKGLDTTMAYVGWIGTQAGQRRTVGTEDLESELVTQLSILGAVPIAKSSMMQTTWDGECDNNILGYLWNPAIKGLSAGGSSGGEGALQSLRGSAFGFGTDVGGSVSMPAAANGVYSLKPSHGRISTKDIVNSSEGQTLIPTVAGIFGQSVEDIRLVFQALLSTSPWLRDPEIVPVPYRSGNLVKGRQLAIGVFSTDGFVTPHPPITRSIRMVAQALAVKGHTLLPWEPPSHVEAMELHAAAVYADGVPDIFERTAISGEPLMPSLRVDEDECLPKPIDIQAYYDIAQRLQKWRCAYADYWNSSVSSTQTGRPVDAIIMPVSPYAAPRRGRRNHFGYSCVVNVLDYCSVVIPVSRVDQSIDLIDADYHPIGNEDRDTWEAYDPVVYHGAPTAVQVVCRRLEEEKLLSVAQVVVDALKAYKTGESS